MAKNAKVVNSIPINSYTTEALSKEFGKRFDMSYQKAKKCVLSVFDVISDALSRDEVVKIHQFGHFESVKTTKSKKIDVNFSSIKPLNNKLQNTIKP
ncbi:MAG: HU family DNA-binding protein [Bacteroidales bacterium]|jgi:nucleoid DNA-binding protein|nr:HU family DNA-binding protein [Bacteroidales bacterium]